jgi:UDP-glucose:(glucosyl)LPS alpha-1,2-glucosyltransferase
LSIEKNELSKNAMGGTELMQHRLHQFVSEELTSKFQIIASRVRKLDPKKKKILWLHDLHGDPEVQHLADGGWEKFDKLVFVSHWQQQMYNAYLGVPFSAGTVLKNAIVPIEEHDKPKDKLRLIYFSTPHRGLDILYAVFEQIAKEHPNVELNVFSSFRLYGWPDRDKPYQDIFMKMKQHPQINYHKSVSNERIREELKRSHILAYPSTWVETSCLVLIEAMSAGLMCVHSSLGALPDTSSNLTMMYDYQEDKNAHAQRFYEQLKMAIMSFENPVTRPNVEVRLKNTKAIADSIYSWDNRKHEWNNLLKRMLTE